MIVAWGFLMATRVRDGHEWPIWVAYVVSGLIGWRLAYHVHLFELEEGEQPDEPRLKRYRLTQLVVTVGFLAVTSIGWLL